MELSDKGFYRIFQWIWTLLPVISLSVLSFIPSLVLVARMRRRPADWAAAALFLAGYIAEIVLASQRSRAGRIMMVGLFAGLWLFMCVAPAVHAYVVYRPAAVHEYERLRAERWERRRLRHQARHNPR